MKLSHSHSACLCLRVDAETESIVLDLSQHGEWAYSELILLPQTNPNLRTL
jgi:hypothetical protein